MSTAMHIIFKLLKKKNKKDKPQKKIVKEESGVKYFKYWKKKISPQPKILYAVKLFFRSEGKLDTFSDRQKPREFTSPEDLSFKKNQEG